jgi:hypothetical protein
MPKIARTEKVDGRLVRILLYPDLPEKSDLTVDFRSVTEEELKLGDELDAINRTLLDPEVLAKLTPAEQKARKDAVEAVWNADYGTRQRKIVMRKMLNAFRQLAASRPTTLPSASESSTGH